MFSSTGSRPKPMDTSSKTTTGSFAGSLCVLSDCRGGIAGTGPGTPGKSTPPLALTGSPPEDADHEPADKEIGGNDEDGGDDDSLGGGAADALGSTACLH